MILFLPERGILRGPRPQRPVARSPLRPARLPAMSIEGGIPGTQLRYVCPQCGKVFFAWRPDTAPGVKIKCYFCKHEIEDEAAKRTPPPTAAPAPTTAS